MFISVFLGDGGGVERSSPCGIQSCVGNVYLFTRSGVQYVCKCNLWNWSVQMFSCAPP